MTSFSLPTSSIRQPQSLLELVKDLGSGYLLAKERKITFIYFNFLLEAAAAVGAVNINRWQILFNDFVKWIKIWRERNPRRCSCSLSPRWSSWSPRCPPGPRKGEAQAMLSIFSTSLHFNSSQIMFCATSRCKLGANTSHSMYLNNRPEVIWCSTGRVWMGCLLSFHISAVTKCFVFLNISHKEIDIDVVGVGARMHAGDVENRIQLPLASIISILNRNNNLNFQKIIFPENSFLVVIMQ